MTASAEDFDTGDISDSPIVGTHREKQVSGRSAGQRPPVRGSSLRQPGRVPLSSAEEGRPSRPASVASVYTARSQRSEITRDDVIESSNEQSGVSAGPVRASRERPPGEVGERALPAGYTRDRNGRVHGPDGKFVTPAVVEAAERLAQLANAQPAQSPRDRSRPPPSAPPDLEVSDDRLLVRELAARLERERRQTEEMRRQLLILQQEQQPKQFQLFDGTTPDSSPAPDGEAGAEPVRMLFRTPAKNDNKNNQTTDQGGEIYRSLEEKAEVQSTDANAPVADAKVQGTTKSDENTSAPPVLPQIHFPRQLSNRRIRQNGRVGDLPFQSLNSNLIVRETLQSPFRHR